MARCRFRRCAHLAGPVVLVRYSDQTSLTLTDIADFTLIVRAPSMSSFYTDFLVGACRRAGFEPTLTVNRTQGSPPVATVVDNDGGTLVIAAPGDALNGRVRVRALADPPMVPIQALRIDCGTSHYRDDGTALCLKAALRAVLQIGNNRQRTCGVRVGSQDCRRIRGNLRRPAARHSWRKGKHWPALHINERSSRRRVAATARCNQRNQRRRRSNGGQCIKVGDRDVGDGGRGVITTETWCGRPRSPPVRPP